MGDLTLTILYFGGVRQLASGERAEELSVESPCRVDQLLDRLCASYPSFARIRPHVRVAVNEAFAEPDATLADGDTVALIPPVAGGQQTLCQLTEEPLDAGALIDAVRGPSQGGLCIFVGTVRDHNDGKRVVRLEYEAYEAMALSELAAIVEQCEAVGEGVRVAVAHRVGVLEIGDAAVIVAASAPHRAEAFEACRLCIERLKEAVPIWKREIGLDGEEWIGLRP